LTALDHTVSHALFEIWECRECTVRFTQRIPDAKGMQAYYRAESYISHTDTSKGLINRLYHIVRKKTLGDKRKLLVSATAKRNGRLLDIGAGTGAFVHYMQQSGWEAAGLEPDEQARAIAASRHQVDIKPIEALATEPGHSYDAITLWHVLEHVHDLHNYLERLKNLLKPGGRIFIAVPNYTSYDARIYQGNWAAYDVPRHLYHFSPDSMKRLFKAHALSLQAIRPMWFDAFYISLLSEKYKNGKGNVVAGFWRGAISNIQALANRERCSSLVYVAAV